MGKKDESGGRRASGGGAPPRKVLEDVLKRLKNLTGKIGFGIITLSAECTIQHTRTDWGDFRQSLRKYCSSLQVSTSMRPNPKPQTPNPKPQTLNPKPQTPDPEPYTLLPTPYTLHPAPYTLHPTPCTLHPRS